MAGRRWGGAWALGIAALLVAWWLLRGASPASVADPVVGVTPAQTTAARAGNVAPAAPIPATGTLPGVVLPPVESATPAEIAVLRDAEVERSAAAPPVATYRGADGRQHAFDYTEAPAKEAAERDDEARRDDVLAQMRADPATYAARNGLRPREVERMLDGSLQIPARLLH